MECFANKYKAVSVLEGEHYVMDGIGAMTVCTSINFYN